jgi:hypothetical protein
MGFAETITNIYLWIGLTFLFLALFLVLIILIVLIAKKTHAIQEFKAWRSGKPIALFFQENRYCEWKPVDVEAGIIADKNYGSFIVNEKATYVDKLTKNILIPFDAQFGVSLNVHSAKLADDLQYLVKDDEQMKMLRSAIANGELDDSVELDALKTSVHMGAIKNMTTAIIPHNINAKIEKVIASRMKGWNKVNVPQIILLFVAIFGAILLGALVIRLAFN